MGADLIEHEAGKFSRAVFVKGGSGDPSVAPGTVDSVTVAPTFVVSSLAGYGNDYFNGWFAYVVWDSAGGEAAPQGESKAITDYVSATGTFSHAAFTAALVAGDKVIISLSDPNASGDASAANQATIIADVTGINGDAMRGTDNAALAATALTDVTWTDAKAAFLTQSIKAGIKKGVARTIVYKMVDATDFATPEINVDVTEEISKDGGAFVACDNADAQISNGWYKILLTATEMNANEIIFKGTGAGCAQCDRLIVTES